MAELLADAGVPEGVLNVVTGDGPGRGRAARASSAGRQDRLHGFDRRRPPHRRGGGRRSQAGDRRAGGQVGPPDLRGRRHRESQSAPPSRPSSSTPDSSAWPAAVCSWPGRSTTRSSRRWPEAPRTCPWAILSTSRPSSDPWSASGTCARWRSYVRCACDDDRATVLAGGARLPIAGGCYFPPTVLSGVANDARVVQEEIFGPVVTVQVVRHRGRGHPDGEQHARSAWPRGCTRATWPGRTGSPSACGRASSG